MPQFKLTLDNECRLDVALAKIITNSSRGHIQSLIKSGNVKVNNIVISKCNSKISGENIIDIIEIELPSTIKPIKQPISIIYEDEHILVINKNAGVVVHPGSGNKDNTLINGLLYHCGNNLSSINGIERPGIVHRLDKDTSGLMVIAKTNHAHIGLAKQFESKNIKKVYIAFCKGIPKLPESIIQTLIGRNNINRKKMSVKKSAGRTAITHYKIIETYKNFASKISCSIMTGRTHQIRVHMQYIKTPIIGDKIYTDHIPSLEIIDTFPRQALHSSYLKFEHPITSDIMEFNSQLPLDLQNLEKQLKAS